MIPSFTIAPDGHTLAGFEEFFRYMILNDPLFRRAFDQCEVYGLNESDTIKALLIALAHDRAKLQEDRLHQAGDLERYSF